ncbi:MAG: hypothetical protein ACUVUR_04145 [bacterium]
MKSKKRTRRKRSTRLRGRPVQEDVEPEEGFFGNGDEIEHDIIDTDEMENFDFNLDEPDETEW